MGWSIPRKKYIAISSGTTNKKKLPILTLKKNAKSFEFTNKKNYSPFSELKQYYGVSPKLDIDLSFSSDSFIFESSKNLTDDNIYNEKNMKKIKTLMKRLKDLSSSEVNNCKRYFMNKKKLTKN